MAKANITVERLRSAFLYDESSGEFYRLKGGRGSKPAGTLHSSGYRYIQIDRKFCLAHRLAWMYVYGVWPDQNIDHINGIRSDNRISNLRECGYSVNAENLRGPKGNRVLSGGLGVYHYKDTDTWTASIVVKGRFISLGAWPSEQEATAAYLTAKRLLHEGCTI